MKVGSKRRRTKTEIADQLRQEQLEKAEAEAKLAQYDRMQ